MRHLAVAALGLWSAFTAGAVARAAPVRTPKRLPLPAAVLMAVDPQAVSVGETTTLTLLAIGTAAKKGPRTTLVLEVDASGRPLRKLGRLRRRAGSRTELVGTVELTVPAPGKAYLALKGSKAHRASERVTLLAVGDTTALAAAVDGVRALSLPADVTSLVPAPEDAALAAAIESLLGPDPGLLTFGARTAPALRPAPAGTTIRLRNATPNTAAEARIDQVGTTLGGAGITIGPLQSARSTTHLYREGAEAAGMTLDVARGVNGLTVFRSKRLVTWLPTTDATGAAIDLVPANFSNSIILNNANMNSLLNDPIIDPKTMELGRGASTAIHELIHAVGFEEGCFDRNDDDESFVDAMEGIVNLKVRIAELKKKRQNTAADEQTLVCRLADLYESQPKGRACMEKLGCGIPLNLTLVPTPAALVFTAPSGQPATPSAQTISVATAPAVPACVKARMRAPRQFDMQSGPQRGVTALDVSVNAAAVTFDENSNEVPLPPGTYVNFIDVSSPSASAAVVVPVTLIVTAPGATTTTSTSLAGTTTTTQAGRAVRLLQQTGPLAAGTEVCLALVTNGCVAPVHEPFCAYVHLHSTPGITISGVGGPYPDPQLGGEQCGYGEIVTKAGCGPDTVPPC